MTDLFLNHNKDYNQDDFDINLNEIIWEKELEICSICRLPLIDDALIISIYINLVVVIRNVIILFTTINIYEML